MTTASAKRAKKSRESTAPKRRDDRTSSDESYPVLLRLPALRVAEGGEQSPDAKSSDAPLASESPTVTNAGSEPKAAEHMAAPAPRQEAVNPSPAPTTSPADRATWSRFQGVRLLGQVFIAALVIGLGLAAYLVLAGGHDASSTAKNSPAPGADQSPPASAEAAQQTEPERPADSQNSTFADAPPVPPDVPEPPASPSLSQSEDPPPQASVPSVEESLVTNAPRSAPANAAVAPATSLLEGTRPQDNSERLPASPSLAADRRGPATEIDLTGPAIYSASRSRAAASQRPLLSEPADPGPPGPSDRAAPSSTYPVTDPGRFQYPAQYQEVLRSRASSRPATDNSTGSAERSANAWQPSTARLQPRLESPPIR